MFPVILKKSGAMLYYNFKETKYDQKWNYLFIITNGSYQSPVYERLR